MPVITSSSLIQTLESVNILTGGAVDVCIKMEALQMPPFFKTFHISAMEALPYWGDLPTPGLIRWEDLCNLLYSILTNRGDLVGTIT